MKTVSDPIVVMKRYEIKYLLSAEKTAYLQERLKGHMQVDSFGLTSIASLYYDTPDYRLIRNSLERAGFTELHDASTMREAVETARKLADKGWCVLLSPACASFDMFRDYEERGRVFKEIVKAL
jgi:UDP-N-acetylmuramoylalanine-D-glutamate ligase